MPTTDATKMEQIDSLFTIEHQGMIAAKYRMKYSDADSERHVTAWPQYKGNHFILYVLAETTREAQKAVFSANKKTFIGMLVSAMSKWTPTVQGAVLTDVQITLNKASDIEVQAVYEKVPNEEERTELLKDYAKGLKLSARTGKQTEEYKARFYHVAGILGIPGNMIW